MLQGRLCVDGAADGAAARGSEGETLEGGEAALLGFIGLGSGLGSGSGSGSGSGLGSGLGLGSYLVVDVRAREERERLARTEAAQADGALCEAAAPGGRLDSRPVHGAWLGLGLGLGLGVRG